MKALSLLLTMGTVQSRDPARVVQLYTGQHSWWALAPLLQELWWKDLLLEGPVGGGDYCWRGTLKEGTIAGGDLSGRQALWDTAALAGEALFQTLPEAQLALRSCPHCFAPHRHTSTGPKALLLNTFSKSFLSLRKVDLLGPPLSHKPVFTPASHSLRVCKGFAVFFQSMSLSQCQQHLQLPTWKSSVLPGPLKGRDITHQGEM